MASNVKKWSAEFLGTFWLTFGGCGSAVLAAAFPEVGIGLLGVSFAFGLTVLTGAYAFGPVSGGHFNPAVSVGLAVAGRFRFAELPGYIIAQVLGAIVAAATLYFIASGKAGAQDRDFFHNYSFYSAVFLAAVFFPAGFFAAGFLAAGFFAAGFFAAGFLVSVFFPAAFFSAAAAFSSGVFFLKLR